MKTSIFASGEPVLGDGIVSNLMLMIIHEQTKSNRFCKLALFVRSVVFKEPLLLHDINLQILSLAAVKMLAFTSRVNYNW